VKDVEFDKEFYYHNKGGWDGFTFKGILRHTFLFKDSREADKMLFAGAFDFVFIHHVRI